MSEYQKLGQKIRAELFQVTLDNPEKNKNEIFTIVMKNLNLEENQRPAVRRCKGALLRDLERIVEVLK